MSLLAAFGPIIPRQHPKEWLRASLGALIGLMAAAAVERATGLGPAFLAPLGATTVLVMAVPSSPLAQPWSSVVGSLMAALAAIPVALLVPMPLAGALAVGLAIVAMAAVRALHPPGGAVALLTALSVDPARPFGVLVPLMLGTVTLVACAVIWARLTGRHYPMRGAEVAEAAFPRIGLHRDELDALLVRFRQSQNMGAADLGRLLAAAEAEAAQHRFQGTICGDVMSRDPISVLPDASLPEIAAVLGRHDIRSLPVADAEGRFLGMIRQRDLIGALTAERDAPVAEAAEPENGAAERRRRRFRGRRGRAAAAGAADAAVVIDAASATSAAAAPPAPRIVARDIMQGGTPRVASSLPIGALLDWLAEKGAQAVAVLEGNRLVGVITRSDVIALLLNERDLRTHAAGEEPPHLLA